MILAQIQRSDRTTLIEHTMALWIATKTDASESERTRDTYARAIQGFRAMALSAGLDLDGFPPTDLVVSPT